MTTGAISDISICNLALASLGEESIRAFSKANTRERLCEVFLPTAKRYVLSQHSWTVARKTVKLQEDTTISDNGLKHASYVYIEPSNCVRPVDISPFRCRKYWKLVGNRIHTDQNPCYLLYISDSVPVTRYNGPLEQAISGYMAIKLALPLTQSKKMYDNAVTLFESMLLQCQEMDATVGSDNLDPDRDPENFKFVNPGSDLAFSNEDFTKRYLMDAEE